MTVRVETWLTPFRALACLLVLFVLLAALVPLRPARAQVDAPPVMPVVLADLSQRAGRTITIADFDDWRWSQRIFEDTSLECPVPGETYEPRPIGGYRIIISLDGATYDYRVTRNGALLTLCPTGGVTPTPTARAVEPTPLATVSPPTATPPGRIVCPNALPSRLAPGVSVQISDRSATSPIRAEPGTDSPIVGQLEPGQPLTIVGGPECLDGLVWWQVDYQMLVGWFPEGQNETYWLEPVSITPPATAPTPGPSPAPRPAAELDLPPNREPLTQENALRLRPFVERPIEQAADALAWSADGRTLAVAAQEGIWLFAAENFGAPPRVLRVANSPVHDVAFSPIADSGQMVTAHDDGSLRLWDVATGGQIAVLSEHFAPVRALAFSPNGTLLASGAGNGPQEPAAIILWDLAAPGPIGRLEGHSGSVRALAFSPDGTLLASGSDDHTVRLWDIVSVTPIAVLEGHTAPVLDIAFSPDAALIASASADGTVRLWDSAAGGGLVLTDEVAAVRALAFAPASGLLVTGSGDGETGSAALVLWDASQQSRLGTVALPNASSTPATLLFGDNGAALAILTEQPTGSMLRLWGVTATE